jgi:hypothetical protein
VKLFSSDGEPAVVGVGMQANAIFACAQVARGFIAIGQVAVGVIAIGQGAFGVVAIGQGGGGITWFAGMMGLGGRGLCLRLIPGVDPPRVAPQTVPFGSLSAGQPGAEGFVRAAIVDGADGARLAVGGYPLPLKPTPAVAWALRNALDTTPVRAVFAHIRSAGGVLVCDRLVEIPGSRRTYSLGFQVARVVLLCALATGWWYAFAWVPWG